MGLLFIGLQSSCRPPALPFRKSGWCQLAQSPALQAHGVPGRSALILRLSRVHRSHPYWHKLRCAQKVPTWTTDTPITWEIPGGQGHPPAKPGTRPAEFFTLWQWLRLDTSHGAGGSAAKRLIALTGFWLRKARVFPKNSFCVIVKLCTWKGRKTFLLSLEVLHLI